ncbi:unnamed protein product [Rotaria sp. Silwood1]|nr:unnamed protein product [Rotaria sp. Silwood1]
MSGCYYLDENNEWRSDNLIVYFILSGNDNDTGLRLLGTEGSILQRGNIDLFLMAVPSCLGPLNYLRIGNDNSGDSSDASWFLK